MANVATYRIQFLNTPIPKDDLEEIKEKLIVPTLGYRDYNIARYYRHQYQNIEGGEIIFNCRWGYDRNALQDYLKTYGHEKSIAWIIYCGEGPEHDNISYITQNEISEYEPVEYGFEEIIFELDDYYWYWAYSKIRTENNDKHLKFTFEEENKRIRIKILGRYKYLTDSEIIDECVSGKKYIRKVFDFGMHNFSEKHGIPISIIFPKDKIKEILKDKEYLYEHISFYWEDELVFQLNSNRFLNYIHLKENRGFEKNEKYNQWKKEALEESFCHESFYSNSNFTNCVNRKYLEWKEVNIVKTIK